MARDEAGNRSRLRRTGAGTGRVTRRAGVVLAVAVVASGRVPSRTQPGCAVGEPIPAYAHNDYENDRPLLDALALGYRGVEVDVHLVRGRLLVAHDRLAVTEDRTLEALYLRPLAGWVARCGSILGDGVPLLLNVEIKSGEEHAYRALRRALDAHRGMLTRVVGTEVLAGPVQVVLVGWQPSLDALEREPERLVAAQWAVTGPDARVPDAPAHLIRLVSLDYGRAIGWSGTGVRPPAAGPVLEAVRRARDAAPGRLARVHNAPVRSSVYRLLFDHGVDLVGTKKLEATRALLEDR